MRPSFPHRIFRSTMNRGCCCPLENSTHLSRRESAQYPGCVHLLRRNRKSDSQLLQQIVESCEDARRSSSETKAFIVALNRRMDNLGGLVSSEIGSPKVSGWKVVRLWTYVLLIVLLAGGPAVIGTEAFSDPEPPQANAG